MTKAALARLAEYLSVSHRLARGLPLRLMRVALAGLAVYLGYGLFGFLSDQLVQKRAFVDGDRVKTVEAGAGYLFRALRDAGLIRYAPQTGLIEVAPADLVQRQLAARRGGQAAGLSDWPWLVDGAGGVPDTELVDRLGMLYGRGGGHYGAMLRGEVYAWNEGRRVAAIRDGQFPADWDDTRHPLIYDGDLPNRWDSDALVEVEGSRVTMPQPSFDGLSTEMFGFLGGGRNPPAGDWRRVSVAGADDRTIRFSRRFDRAEWVTVDLVGRNPRIDGARVQPAEQSFCPAGNTRATACRPGQSALAHRLQLQPAGTGPVRVALDPVIRFPRRLLPYRGHRYSPRGCVGPTGDGRESVDHCAGWFRYRGSEALVLRCRRPAGECRLSWRPGQVARASRTDAARVALLTADRVPLTVGAQDDTRPGARPSDPVAAAGPPGDGSAATPPAAELGLLSVIGLGTRDRGGLSSGWLRYNRYRDPGPLTLTVRADLQRLAQRALQEELAAEKDRYLKGYAEDRRAVLVVLDAGGEAPFGDDATRGDILVSAQLPQPAVDRSMWNLTGLAAWSPARSPLTPLAWRGTSDVTAPGSTFKPLVALALVRDAVERGLDGPAGDGARALRGRVRRGRKDPGLDLPAYARPDGVTLRADSLLLPRERYRTDQQEPCWRKPSGPKVWKFDRRVCNFRREYHRQGFIKPAVSGCPAVAGNSGQAPQYGLCEATVVSMNTWFMAALVAVDGDALLRRIGGGADRWDGEAAGPPAMQRMAERLLPPGSRDLSGWTDPPSLAAARYRAEPMVLSSASVSYDGLFNLALNAIGQAAQASPLAVATLYASIATGCRVSPRLVMPGGTAERGCPPLFFDHDPERELRARALMDSLLIPGLVGVVNSTRGTAYSAFKKTAFRAHLRAKTGTAEVGSRQARTNTAWLAGWIEPEGSGPWQRRLAFACMITHAAPGSTGGQVCGPVVRRFLSDLQTHDPDEAPR